MIEIALWAALFTGPLTEIGQVFGWIKEFVYTRVAPLGIGGWRDTVYYITVGCAKCHAGQIAFWFQVWQLSQGRGFDFPFILYTITAAMIFSFIFNKIK